MNSDAVEEHMYQFCVAGVWAQAVSGVPTGASRGTVTAIGIVKVTACTEIVQVVTAHAPDDRPMSAEPTSRKAMPSLVRALNRRDSFIAVLSEDVSYRQSASAVA